MGINDALGRNLERLRKNRRLAQKEIAAMLGITQTAYSTWERSKVTPPLDKLVTLARFYSVSLDQLCGLSTAAANPYQTKGDLVGSLMNLETAGATVTAARNAEGKQVLVYMPAIPWLTEFFEAWENMNRLQGRGLLEETEKKAWLDARLAKLNEEPLEIQ